MLAAFEGAKAAEEEPARDEEPAPRTAPGRRTLTMNIPRSPAGAAAAALPVQRKADPDAEAARATRDAETRRLLDAALRPDLHEAPGAIAARGVEGSGGALPHLDRIQQAFGKHDISGIRAHVGGRAAEASQQLGASAYATGDAVGFGASPDLFTAAHEAAHVVQQRAGVQLAGGIDGGDDEYERHADAVAERVVRGESAEALLDQYAGGCSGGAAAAGAAVQRRTYMQLSDNQQEQIDALAKNIFRSESEAFEARLGQVAAAAPASNNAANDILQHLAQYDAARAATHLGQQAGTLPVKAAYLAAANGLPASARVEASRSETRNQTYVLPPRHEANRTHLLNHDRTATIGPKQAQPNGVETRQTANGGQVRDDSVYGTHARESIIPVRGAGSREANTLFQVAIRVGASLVNAKAVAFGWLLPLGAHSFHEIMMSAAELGAPYNDAPGERYDYINPFTAGEVGRLSPSHFFSANFLIVLSEVFFPDNPGQRAHGLGLMPAGVAARIQNQLLPGFVGVHGDAALQPVLAAGIARTLVEQMHGPTLLLLSQFITGNLINNLNTWPAVTGHATYQAVAAAAGAGKAQLIFGHLLRRRLGGATPALQTELASAQHLLTSAPAAAQNDAAVGFAPGHAAALTHQVGETVASYGPHDRGMAVNAGPLAALSNPEASSLHDYTTMSFVNYHGALGSGTTPEQLFTTGGQAATDQLLARMHACKTGLERLPVFPGPVFRGTSHAQVQNPTQLAAHRTSFNPGKVIAHNIFLSAARTLEDSFVVPMDLAFVIDDVRSARNLQLLSSGPTMREVLFPPHARFVVERVEDRLTPGNPHNNPHHVFTGGNLWIYLREIGERKSDAERTQRNQDFQDEWEIEREGRRLVDENLYQETQTAHMTGALPVAEPRDRLEHQGATAGINPAVPLPTTQYDDWRAARQHMEGRVGQPLSFADIATMHGHAAAHLPNAGPGAMRGNGQESIGRGGIGPNGNYSKVTPAQLAALQGNNLVQVQQLGAQDALLTPAEQLANVRTVLIVYLPSAQVPAAAAGFVGWYANECQRVAGIANPATKRQEAIRTAARAQRNFVSIHPFADGNGRVSRLIMDHCLLSFGIEPAIIADTNQDILVDENTWIQQVGQGVTNTENLRQSFVGA